LEERKTKRKQFWQRQFAPAATRLQIAFDIVVGIIIPLILLSIDPIVFRAQPCSTPILGKYATFAYFAISLGCLSLAVWLSLGMRRQIGAAFIGGIMASGTLFALSIGIALLPYSVIGLLIFGLGALGFVPFLTAWVYYRNCRRAYAIAKSKLTAVNLALMMATGAVLAVSVPYLIHTATASAITNTVDQLAASLPAQDQQAINDLNRVSDLCLNLCNQHIKVAFDSLRLGDAEQKQASEIYQNVTGEPYYTRASCYSD
jgi:hypothetical protein